MTRVFVAGAAGAIGRRLVPQLLAAGYQVLGTTRSAVKAAQLRAQGAAAVIVDVLDPAALNRALVTAKPDAVIHQLTDLPANPEPARAGDYAARNARLRRLGTAHLVSAVLQAGMRRLIAQSIAWTYCAADAPRTEADALDLAAGGTRAVSIGGVVALETAVLGNAAFTGIVLRYGALYGPGTGAEQPREGQPAFHVDAAAHAALLALNAPAGSLQRHGARPAGQQRASTCATALESGFQDGLTPSPHCRWPPGGGHRRTVTGAMIRRRSCHRTWSTEPWRPSDPLH